VVNLKNWFYIPYFFGKDYRLGSSA